MKIGEGRNSLVHYVIARLASRCRRSFLGGAERKNLTMLVWISYFLDLGLLRFGKYQSFAPPGGSWCPHCPPSWRPEPCPRRNSESHTWKVRSSRLWRRRSRLPGQSFAERLKERIKTEIIYCSDVANIWLSYWLKCVQQWLIGIGSCPEEGIVEKLKEMFMWL